MDGETQVSPAVSDGEPMFGADGGPMDSGGPSYAKEFDAEMEKLGDDDFDAHGNPKDEPPKPEAELETRQQDEQPPPQQQTQQQAQQPQAEPPPPPPEPPKPEEVVKTVSETLMKVGKLKMPDGSEVDFKAFSEEFPEAANFLTAGMAVLSAQMNQQGVGRQEIEAAKAELAELRNELGRASWERGVAEIRQDAIATIKTDAFRKWASDAYAKGTPGDKAIFDSNDPRDTVRVVEMYEAATGIAAKRGMAQSQQRSASLHSVGQPGARRPAPGAAKSRSFQEEFDAIRDEELD